MNRVLTGKLSAACEGVVLSNPACVDEILSGDLEKDIDLLIKEAGAKCLISQAESCGYYMELKRHSPDQMLLYRYDPEVDQLFMLDVIWQYRVSFRKVSYVLRQELVSRCFSESAPISNSKLRIVSPSWRLFFVLSSVIFKGRSPDYYKEELVDSDGHKSLLLCNHLVSLGLSQMQSKQLTDILFSSSKEGHIFGVINSFLAKFFQPNTHVTWYFQAFALSWRHRLMRPPFVAIVGLDGTGKSTLVEHLLSRLPIKIRRHYWASRSMILPTTRLHRYMERKFFKRDVTLRQPEFKPIPETAAGVKKLRRHSLIKWLVLLAIFANKYAEYWAKFAVLSIHRLCGTRIVTDRYVYDERMEHADPFVKINAWLYTHAYPSPSLLVVTTASPEDVCARRPSITLEQAFFYLSDYDTLANDMENRGVDVLRLSSTHSEVEDNIRELLSKIFPARPETSDRSKSV